METNWPGQVREGFMKMALLKLKAGKHVGVSVGSKYWVDLEEVT